MADMDTIIIRNRPNGERISATLGPDGDKVSRIEILRMIAKAIKDVRAGNGRDVDLSI